MSETHSGGCLCGAVRITVEGPLGPVSACHCAQCRRQSGHYWAATEVPRAAVRIEGEAALRWYQASPRARRDFCGTCGSFLLWQLIENDMIDVAMGALDAPSGTALAQHIFVAEKGDYYTIADGLPQRAD
ncbi:MAG: aldehyde-activating protein [Proteobacteria bacterium SG_bin6]|nr:MAG: aldehyde-activating protein [Proteobacteria bacterium SG_bin6]